MSRSYTPSKSPTLPYDLADASQGSGSISSSMAQLPPAGQQQEAIDVSMALRCSQVQANGKGFLGLSIRDPLLWEPIWGWK